MEHQDRFKRSAEPIISPATFFIGLIAVIFLCLINFWLMQFICQINSRLKKLQKSDSKPGYVVRENERTEYGRGLNLSPTTKKLRARDCGKEYYKALNNENKIDEDFQKIVKKYTQEDDICEPE